jgi:hypothetical protein
MDNTLMPDIEDDVPLPSSAMEALPELSPVEELEMRARTIKLISDLTGVAISPNVDQAEAAKDLAREMMTDPKKRIEYAKYPSETMAYLAGLIAQTNVSLVDELSDLKMYVVNKLIFEVENAPDSKTRITALSKLGEVDGVDAFKRRTEMTVQIKPMAEVEKELLEALNVLETKFVEVQPKEIARHNEFTQHAE